MGNLQMLLEIGLLKKTNKQKQKQNKTKAIIIHRNSEYFICYPFF